MLLQTKMIKGFAIESLKGDAIGKVADFIFDDEHWTIRYLVVDTGNWLVSQKVLISPAAINKLKYDDDVISVAMTREQIQNSPPIEKHMPVSRKKELELAKYYQWPLYWSGVFSPSPGVVVPQAELFDQTDAEAGNADDESESHLRSFNKVTGYHIHALDGEIGKVVDFIFDDDNWIFYYLVVDIGNLIQHKHVVLPPAWTQEVNWEDAAIYVDVNQKSVQNSPDYHPDKPMDRPFEQSVYDFFERQSYW